MSKSRIEHQHSANVFEWGNVGLNENWEKVGREKKKKRMEKEREWRKKENEERKRNGPTNEQNNCDW